MILQALVQLYEELVRQGKVTREGWDKAKVSHRILLSEAGDIEGIISVKTKAASENEEMAKIEVPIQKGRSGKNPPPYFLCDNSKYFLGFGGIGKEDMTLTKDRFEAARKFHHLILDHCESVIARAILRFFDHWDVDRVFENQFVASNLQELESGNLVFQVNGKDATEDREMQKAWRMHLESEGEKESIFGQCLVTGELNQRIVRLHGKVKGVLGAERSGANLVSFNEKAFCSYGYDGEQGKNAPVGEYAALAYVKALNYLLSDFKHREILGDTTVVYWSEHAETEYQDCMSAMLDDDDLIDEATLKQIMQNMKDGKPSSLQGITISPEEPFYVLGLAPNVARISVRFLMKNTFGEMMRNLIAHQERLQIVHAPFEKDSVKIWMILSNMQIVA